MDNKNLPTTQFNKMEIQSLKEAIKDRWTVFEANLIKSIEGITLGDGSLLDQTWIIKRYADIVENAEKVNPKTGEMIPDHETRMKALDKLTKIMLWQSGNAKGVTVNINAPTNIWNNIPKQWEHLIH